jgi:hypothetical protein
VESKMQLVPLEKFYIRILPELLEEKKYIPVISGITAKYP